MNGCFWPLAASHLVVYSEAGNGQKRTVEERRNIGARALAVDTGRTSPVSPE